MELGELFASWPWRASRSSLARVFLICGVGRGEGKKHQEAEIISVEGVTGFSLEMKPWGRDELHPKPRAICATPHSHLQGQE